MYIAIAHEYLNAPPASFLVRLFHLYTNAILARALELGAEG
jgi:hypothetical protein